MPSKLLSLQGIISESNSAASDSERVANSLTANAEQESARALAYAQSEVKKTDERDVPKLIDAANTTLKRIQEFIEAKITGNVAEVQGGGKKEKKTTGWSVLGGR